MASGQERLALSPNPLPNTHQAIPPVVDERKPKRCGDVVSCEPQPYEDKNTLETTPKFEIYKAEICRPLPFLIAMKAIRSSETKLIDGILTNVLDSIMNLARIAQKMGIIPLEVMNTLKTLDPSIPHRLRCRYLLLHAYEYMSSLERVMHWLKALSLVEGTASALSQIKQENDFLAHKIGSVLSSVERVQEFGSSLGIWDIKIEEVTASCALERVILQRFYSDHIKQYDTVALAEKVGKFCDVSLSHFAKRGLKIIHQTTEVQVIEGNSALLEVQVEGNPKLINYVLYHHEKDTVHKFNSGILSLCDVGLVSEGHYTFKLLHYHSTQFCDSKPIHMAVVTPLDKYQEVLIDKYTARPEVPVDTWPPKSSVSFINLALIKQENIQKAGEYGRCTIRGDMDDIIKDKEGIMYDKAMGNILSGERVLIEGRPGSGKTTFVHKLSRDWANKDITINYVRLFFLIQLRVFSSDPNINLHDIIGCYCNDHQGLKEIVKYAAKHNGLGLGFVLDGLDEYQPQDKNAFIFKLIRKEVLPKSVVIVASRPAATADFRSIATRHIEVLGFLKPQIHDYIDSYPFYADCNRPGLHKYLDVHLNVLHMCYLPIHISMVCFLYDKLTKDLPETETEIYRVFTKFAVLRMLYRYKSKSEVSLETLNDLSPLHKNRYLEVCKLAFRMTLSTKQVMRQAEVKSLLATIEEKELFGLITVDNIATMCGFQDVYTFLHLTFQEFLAAYYISSLEEKEQMELIEEHGKAMQMKQVWKFYCGLVEFDASGSKFKTLVSQAQHGTLHRIQCSFESHQPSTCDHVVEDNCLKFSDCFMTSSDFTAMAFVISNTHQQCVLKVVIDTCTFGLEEVDILARKSNARLSLITTLCYHGHNCTDAQLAALKKLTCSLSGLKVLGVTSTNFEDNNFSIFVTDFKHASLEILKVSITHDYIPTLFYAMAKAFFSQCSNFVNICFTGCDPEKVDATLLPYIFYCNFREIDMSFGRLRPIELEVLSSDLQVNGERTTILSLTSCGIDDNAVSCLARGIKNCTTLEILNLNCNFIGDDGAISIADTSISRRNLSFLNLSCNKIGNRGALAIASALKHKECSLHLWNNSFSNHESILAIMPKADFRTLTVTRYVSYCSDLPSFREVSELSKNLLVLNLTGCTLTDKGVKALGESLKCCSSLQSFGFGSIFKKTTHLRTILSALLHCKDLHNLSLTNIELSAGGLKMFANFLKRTSLFKLNINHSHIYEHVFQVLAGALESSALRSLNISYCDIGNAGIAAKFHTLRELDISSNDIQCQGAQAMACGLKHCFCVAVLDISRNQIGDDGTCSLAKALIHCTRLTKLNMKTNGIGDDGACALANALVQCTNFTKLNISHNDIRSRGACSLAKALVDCTNLTKLNIGTNHIGDDGAYGLANALVHYTNLTELKVNCNDILSKGACSLAEALVHCNNLTKLNIGTNRIGDDGACALANALVHCTNLTELNISQNLIRNRGACSLANVLVCFTNLTNLNISHNYIREKGASALANALVHCTNLNISHDDFSAWV